MVSDVGDVAGGSVSRCRTGSWYVGPRNAGEGVSDAIPLLTGRGYGNGGVGEGVLASERCLGGRNASGGAGGNGEPMLGRDGSPPRVWGTGF